MNRSLLKWHRYLGIAVAVTAIVVAITGVLLNHTDDLGLDRKFASSKWILHAYGIELPANRDGFELSSGQWLVQVGDQIFVNDKSIITAAAALVGAVVTADYHVVVSEQSVYLFDRQWQAIETISGLPLGKGAISAVGLTAQDRVILDAGEGNYLLADEILSQWLPASEAAEALQVNWSQRQSVPQQLMEQLQFHWLGAGITLERIVLDLHSGRIFRQWGVIILDIAAVGMILLAISGVWIWFKRVSRSFK